MRVGMDLGGTKIEAVVLDETGGEKFRERVPTPAQDYDAIVAAIGGLLGRIDSELGRRVTHLGIGAPGAISPATGLVKNSNTTALIGRPLDKDLERLLGVKVRLANDANCFALSEATDGAGAGAQVVFGVIIGTGTGAGVVVRGQVLNGANSIAGEWGHNPLPWPQTAELPGADCYCGRRGCIETFLSGPGMARDYLENEKTKLASERIAELAQSGDPAADRALERYEDRMARSLASIMNVLDPDVIVLGGGVSNIERLYSNVPRIWGKYVFSDHITTRLVRAKFGDSSGVRGAAWLWG